MSEGADYISDKITTDAERARRAEAWADRVGRECSGYQDRIKALEDERDKLKAELEAAQKACAEMRQVVEHVLSDPHQWSLRPCPTCREASEVIGYPVGCYRYHAQCGKVIEALKFRSNSCGQGYFSREQIEPLHALIDRIYRDALVADGHKVQINTPYLRQECAKALAHAQAIGIEVKA